VMPNLSQQPEENQIEDYELGKLFVRLLLARVNLFSDLWLMPC